MDTNSNYDPTTADLSKWLRIVRTLDQHTRNQAADRLDELEYSLSVSHEQHRQALDWYDEARGQVAAARAASVESDRKLAWAMKRLAGYDWFPPEETMDQQLARYGYK